MNNIGRDYKIEYLRCFATIAVIILHSFGQPLSIFSMDKLGNVTSYVYNIIQLSCRWAVPCFFMITGALLLNPGKELSLSKIKKYVLRISFVLFLFGSVFAFMELFFEERIINPYFIFSSLLNTLQNKSWSHLWYLYTLISLYLITPILRSAVKEINKTEYFFTLIILIIGNIVIANLNYYTGLEISNFMLFPECLLYYLTGYFIIKYETEIHFTVPILLLAGFISFMLNALISSLYLYKNGVRSDFLESPANILVFILSISVFLLSRKFLEKKSKFITRSVAILSSTGLTVYIIHPVFLNFIYKFCHYTPEYGGAFIVAIITIFASVFLSYILKKLPFLKKIL